MLETLYYIFTVILVVLLLMGYYYFLTKEKMNKQHSIKRVSILFFGFIIWFSYLALLSYTEVLKNFDLPPRFPLLIMLPAFIFVIAVLRLKRKTELVKNTPLYLPVLFESFRIPVELLLHGTFIAGLIPVQTTYSGYNFEIYFAASALIMGLLVYKKLVSKKVILIWNIIGLGFLATILGIFMTAIFYPQFWGQALPMVSLEFGTMPFILVPGFYVPLAVFMHGLSIIQVTKK